MAQPIVAVRGFEGSITINSVAAKLRQWDVDVSNATISYATTGQTADGDGVYSENTIAGLNSAIIKVSGYWDQHATSTSRFTGSGFGLKPGTTATGVVTCLYKSGSGFTATVVVQSIRATSDAESNKPSGFEATLKVDGAVTYVLS